MLANGFAVEHNENKSSIEQYRNNKAQHHDGSLCPGQRDHGIIIPALCHLMLHHPHDHGNDKAEIADEYYFAKETQVIILNFEL